MSIGLLGVVIHIVFLYSIFDIYFKSPLIHGMTPYTIPAPAPAKRVVLFIADGLRADKFFELDEKGNSRAPFLRDIVINSGAWGISHTRVPTESRPGHVALAAGIYEDVSAVTRGWKENPVDFDSVFNESRYTWAWGSPDILPMFAKGTKIENVFIETYSGNEEDFASSNPSHLDTWVFQKIEKFFSDARNNNTLSNMLGHDKLIFFPHLLGLDTSGHAYKPNSKEYLSNIEVVDKGVEKVVNSIESYYNNDGKTAYIFTADHGMTDWGSHGAGHPHETHTPFVSWGAGLRGPLGEGKDLYYDGFSESWRLSAVKRVDINQVDVAPLIATLIGIPFPVNSLGILPVEFLNTEWPHKAVALLTNARQVLAQYKLKMKLKQANTLPIFFRNFKEMSAVRQAELMSMIETLMKQNRYTDAIQVGLKLIELALKGLVYYQKYDRFILSFSILLGFVGWMSYIVVLILRDYTVLGHNSSLESSAIRDGDNAMFVKTTFLFLVVSAVIGSLLYVQSAPPMYYVYFFLPVILWYFVCLRLSILEQAKDYVVLKNNSMQFFAILFASIGCLELIVLSYFRREVLCIGLWGLAFWPFTTSLKLTQRRLVSLWVAVCLAMSIFPLLPVVGRDSHYNLVVLAGWLNVLAVAYCARRPETGLIYNNRQMKKEPSQVVYLTALQVIILCIAMYNVRSTSWSISHKEGLSFLNQITSWLVLGTSFILPLFGSKSLITRLLNIMTSISAPYLLMCISHEALFCLMLCILMFLWIFLEHNLSDDYRRLQDITFDASPIHVLKTQKPKIGFEDLRRAYFFIFFILLAFFGTGNIASLNSFEPSSVYCYLTVFNPFVMGFLMLLKVVIPFIIVTCSFRAILITLKVSPRSLFLLILLMSDFVSLHFFFLVRDTGSWLEIGTSISHYVINMTVLIFIMLLYGLAWLLTSFNLQWSCWRIKRHVQ